MPIKRFILFPEPTEKVNKVLIIGGGASGMVAAIAAGRKGNKVTILEGMGRLGKKILLTGNGRCNLTNESIDLQNYHGENPKFIKSVFARFSKQDSLKFFHSLGLATIVEDDGRIFPRSGQAQSVVDVLRFELERLEIPIFYNKRVKEIKKVGNGFEVICSTGKKYKADKVIIATGGKTYPSTGSRGDGYNLAKLLGHTIVKPIPTSVPLKVKSQVCHKLQGVKPDVSIQIFDKDKLLIKHSGTIMFAHFGFSGPVILEASRPVSHFLAENPGKSLKITINFFPEYSKEQVDKLLQKRFEAQPKRSLNNSFVGLLISKIAPAIFENSGIDGAIQASEVSKELRRKIVALLTEYEEKIIGTLNWDQAQFTAGGVSTKEINSQTMESKLVPGLYFCGEVVDIDGDCGGYNLQWAWSSGWVAGASC